MSLGFIPAAVENVPPDEREFDANPSRFRSATPSLFVLHAKRRRSNCSIFLRRKWILKGAGWPILYLIETMD
jgi:hypothetical protein